MSIIKDVIIGLIIIIVGIILAFAFPYISIPIIVICVIIGIVKRNKRKTKNTNKDIVDNANNLNNVTPRDFIDRIETTPPTNENETNFDSITPKEFIDITQNTTLTKKEGQVHKQKTKYKDWRQEFGVWKYKHHIIDGQSDRYFRALSEDINFRSVSIKGEFAEITGTSGTVYETSLNYCSCPDFQERHLPCKHIYFLAYELGKIEH